MDGFLRQLAVSVLFGRQFGHMDCRTLRYGGGWGTAIYPFCQFTSPNVLTVVTDAAKVIAAMERADTPWPAQPVRPATRAAWTRCAPTSSQTHSCSAAPTCRSAHVGASRVHSPRSRAP